MSFKILGTGHCVPSRVVTNDEMSTIVETSDEWIAPRVGVRERRVCTTETASDLAFEAAQQALAMSGTKPEELDMILCATLSADEASPSMACMMQNRLGASCPALDVNAACSGFIYALDTAAGFFARKKVKKMLVIGGERLSRLIDWTDRNTCVIFADGAGAVVLGEGDDYLSSKLYAKGCETIVIPQYAGDSPFNQLEARKPFIRMNGQETFKFAVNAMAGDIIDVINAAGLKQSDIAWVVPHQANARIIDAASRKLDIPADRFGKNIEKYGNTSAASVPILLDELNRAGKFKKGDYLALASFGGGLTSAACIIRWGI
ncbi:3-oxoacyl-[acyl-carrier-protein] synthase-3 [Sporobacter termitidis DSM 10068]|uniref:Beta-ketoacyl-[acyl-carrier-protein] synthase III n=1 Tax=Sporobacter termitidis DSM 10068 TaxID=1123282 RepID=A0A1M5X217_9FIRM|nr:beta-ketoacyl-ACP synthase III [Sporobacter termitidis]SHH93925.1 3-oxoacyl-[acyl-carrier-protein] synthase-3 [Sporobacter termitidis DSM 10068]